MSKTFVQLASTLSQAVERACVHVRSSFSAAMGISPGHGAIRRGVQQIAQQAFWDVLAEGLAQRPPQWERLLALLDEARSMLLELIPENAEEGKQLRASVLEKLNMVRPQSAQKNTMSVVCSTQVAQVGLIWRS